MSDDEFASKFMDAIFSPSEQGIPTNEENKRKAREYLSSLRTLAARAEAAESFKETVRELVVNGEDSRATVTEIIFLLNKDSSHG